jgi:molecular chaperone DnaK (HSP70)
MFMNTWDASQPGAPKSIVVLDDQAHIINAQGLVSENVGIVVYDGKLAPLIKRGEPYPCEKSFTFSTTADFQKEIELHFYRGNQPKATDNLFLGKIEMRGFRLMPAGQPKVRLFIRAAWNSVEVWATDEIDRNNISIIHEMPGEYIPPSEPEHLLKNADFELMDFALSNYGEQTEGVQTNLFSSVGAPPKRLRWSVEIEELFAARPDGWQDNKPTRGAVLDLLITPNILVQVTLHAHQEFLVKILAEKTEYSTESNVSYKVIISKIVANNSPNAIRRALEDLISEGPLPRELPN